MTLTTRKIHPIVKSLIPIVKTIGLMFGKNCEVVLHDFSGPKNSIIEIENGHVTGRKVGDPITDFALVALKNGGFGEQKDDKVLNYKTKTKDGKIIKSCSVLVKDENDAIVGCLCLNYDMTAHLMFEKLLNGFCNMAGTNAKDENLKPEETFATDVSEVLENIMSKAIEEINIPVSLMQKEENLRVVEIVDEKGGFMIKGSIDQMAKKLNVSRFTIYNYLEEVKAKKIKHNEPTR